MQSFLFKNKFNKLIKSFSTLVIFIFSLMGCSNFKLTGKPAVILRDTLNVKVTNYCPKDGFTLKEVFALNLSSVRDNYNFQLDTDRDGLSDEVELSPMAFGYNLSFLNPDTNDDGYSDLLLIRVGIDVNSQKSLNVCPSHGQDTDLDMITDCDESIIGTNHLNPDSDFDGIPDGLEFRNALNPLDIQDSLGDFDGDGYSVLKEIKRNSPWQTTDNDDIEKQALKYSSLEPTNENPDCMDVKVSGISIMESSNGNIFKLIFLETKFVAEQGEVNRLRSASVLFPSDALANINITVDGANNQLVVVDQVGNIK